MNTTTELALADPHPAGLEERMTYARALAAAELLPQAYRKRPADLLLAIEYGDALGLPLASILTSVHLIDGRPTASAALLAALVRRAGHRLRLTGDDTQATAELVRADDPEYVFRSVWTIERARTAGLAGKGTWAKFPASMLKARALTEVIRDGAPEVGILDTPDEIGHAPGAGAPAAWPTTVEPVTVDTTTGEMQAGQTIREAFAQYAEAHPPTPPAEAEIVEAEIVPEPTIPPAAHDPAKVTRTARVEPATDDPWHQVEPPPDPEPAPRRQLKGITSAQTRMLGALTRKLALTREDALELARAVTGIPDLASAADLSSDDASTLLTHLSGLTDAVAEAGS